MSTMVATHAGAGGMTKDERFVILASSLGTVFEWYDFYLYGSLASIIGAQFFSAYPPADARHFSRLLAFAGASWCAPSAPSCSDGSATSSAANTPSLVTILIMVCRPSSSACCRTRRRSAFAAPVILIALRPGARPGARRRNMAEPRPYVAEHAPKRQARLLHSFIQTTATLGLLPVAAGDSVHPYRDRRN